MDKNIVVLLGLDVIQNMVLFLTDGVRARHTRQFGA